MFNIENFVARLQHISRPSQSSNRFFYQVVMEFPARNEKGEEYLAGEFKYRSAADSQEDLTNLLAEFQQQTGIDLSSKLVEYVEE